MHRILSAKFALCTTLLLAASLSIGNRSAQAWEPATTHAGLTEVSALSSDLHQRIQHLFGNARGLYTSLQVPEKDAPSLFSILRKLSPTHGYIPDGKGKMSAMAWLVAGSVIADVPTQNASNHFFDPRKKTGLSDQTGRGIGHSLSRLRANSSTSLEAGGVSAFAWWRSPDNSMGYLGFADQFRKAVSASSPAARQRHLAGSLLAAGAMLHVLQDMGSPSHVRDDLGSHQEQVTPNQADHGSRFERIAALAFGRLGIPKSQTAPTLSSLGDHFSNASGTGLSDLIEKSYFSNGTLPELVSVRRDVGASIFQDAIQKRLRRPFPAAHSQLDLIAAKNHQGATWLNEQGVCLARYQWKLAKLRFWIDDDCALEQLEEILPKVAGYGASFLEHLYADTLTLHSEAGRISVQSAAPLPAGTLTFYADDAQGQRKQFHQAKSSPDKSTVAPAPPSGSTHIAVLYEAADSAGRPTLLTAAAQWPLSP